MNSARPHIVRIWDVADAGVLAAGWADPDVRAWNEPPADASLEAAARWIAGGSARWARRISLDMAIVDPGVDDPDRAVGEVGLANLTQDPARAEVGFWLLPSARGRGLATWAVEAISGWALCDPAGPRLAQVWARADPANTAAEAVLGRAGFSMLGSRGPWRIWARTRDDVG